MRAPLSCALDNVDENGKSGHRRCVQGHVGKIGEPRGEHQSEQLWPRLCKLHIGQARGDDRVELRPGGGGLGGRKLPAKRVEALRGQRGQQSPGVAEMMREGCMADAGALCDLPQRKSLDPVFFKLGLRLFEQLLPQIAVMKRPFHTRTLNLNLSSVKIKLDSGKIEAFSGRRGGREALVTFLISGLVLFFGAHFYSAFRSRDPERDVKARMGEGPYMGLYSLVSGVGLGLLIYGYWSSPEMDILYVGPDWALPVMKGGMLVALILIVSAYVPGNHLRQIVRHPMILATGVWAGSHLLLPTDTKELLLFGSFFLFAIVDSVSAFARPSANAGAASLGADAVVVGVAGAIYAALLFGLHAVLFGVPVW